MLHIYAHKDGVDLLQYQEAVFMKERDRHNEYRLEFSADNGDSYFLYIPADCFRDFVIACQKLQAKGVFDPISDKASDLRSRE